MEQKRSIILWLCIFIIGSLIVSFIVYPQTFHRTTNNVDNVIKKVIPEKQVKVDTSNLIRKPTNIPCSVVDMSAQEQGVSSNQLKETACIATCQTYDNNYEAKSNYNSFASENDYLVCYCNP